MCFKAAEKGIGLADSLVIPNRKQYHRRLEQNFKKKALRPPKEPPRFSQIKSMRMTKEVFEDIKNQIGSRPAESGGILISKSQDFIITTFVFDSASAKHSTIYQPNTEFLNSALKGRNNEFVGIAHSHPPGARQLTSQDQRAAWSNLTSPGNPHLQAYLMPLIQTIPDTGRFEIIPYIVTCHPKGMGNVIVRRVKLKILN